MSNLKNLRDRWERGLEILLEIPDAKNQFIVILKGKEYSVYRYFKLGDRWSVSIDARREDCVEALLKLKDLNIFSKKIPEE